MLTSPTRTVWLVTSDDPRLACPCATPAGPRPTAAIRHTSIFGKERARAPRFALGTRYTSPMSPAPILAVTEYGPRVVPGSTGIAKGWSNSGAAPGGSQAWAQRSCLTTARGESKDGHLSRPCYGNSSGPVLDGSKAERIVRAAQTLGAILHATWCGVRVAASLNLARARSPKSSTRRIHSETWRRFYGVTCRNS